MRVIAFHTGAEAARKALDQIAAAAPAGAAVPVIAPVTYERLYAASITGEVMHIVNDTIWTDDGVEATARLAERLATAPNRECFAMVNFRARPRPLPDAAASGVASAFLSWAGAWTEPADEPSVLMWFDDVIEALEPYRTGCYVNETDFLRHPERAAYCYSADAWRRLQRFVASTTPEASSRRRSESRQESGCPTGTTARQGHCSRRSPAAR